MEFVIYTDGGCIGNKRDTGCPGAYAYIIMDSAGSELLHGSGRRENTTNNQMELKAVIIGIKKLYQQNIPIKYNHIEVRTDSKYVTDNKNKTKPSEIKSLKGWASYLMSIDLKKGQKYMDQLVAFQRAR